MFSDVPDVISLMLTGVSVTYKDTLRSGQNAYPIGKMARITFKSKKFKGSDMRKL